MPFSSVVGAQSVVRPGVCTSSTRPAAPFDGQVVYLTDTDQTLVWDGAAWTVLAPIAGGRNSIINGAFDVWQRSTDATTAGSYGYATADRWISRTSTGPGSVRVSRQLASDLTGFRYCARVQRTASNTDTGGLQIIHILETANSIKFAGKTVTLSFYARNGANYSPAGSGMSPLLYSGTGTDQHWTSFTSQSTAIAQTVALSATWQRFSYSATIAPTTTQLYMMFQMNPTGTAGANDYFEITGVQLEVGAVATPFEFEDIGDTLRKCMRYFQKSFRQDIAPATATGSFDGALGWQGNGGGFGAWCHKGLPVIMRSAPVVTLFNPVSANSQARNAAAGVDIQSCTASGYTSTIITVASGTNDAASQGSYIHYTLSSEL
jgi:hypothetical protein